MEQKYGLHTSMMLVYINTCICTLLTSSPEKEKLIILVRHHSLDKIKCIMYDSTSICCNVNWHNSFITQYQYVDLHTNKMRLSGH